MQGSSRSWGSSSGVAGLISGGVGGCESWCRVLACGGMGMGMGLGMVGHCVHPLTRWCVTTQCLHLPARSRPPVAVTMLPTIPFCCCAAADRTIKIWDTASGQLRLTLTGHIEQVTGLAVSARHPYMFSCGLDKMVKCWDLEQNKVGV